MILLALIFIAAAAALGVSVLGSLRLTKEIVTTAALGITGGLSTVTFILFAVSPLLPLSLPVMLLVTVALVAGSYVLLTRYEGWQQLWQLHLDKPALVWAILIVAACSFIAPKILFTHDGGLATGIINNYGDVAWHAALTTSFAVGQSTPPINPIYAGHVLAYPFLADFASALLVITGATLPQSFGLLALIMVPTMLVLFYLVTLLLTGSRHAASIALLLLIFSGSTFGWTQLAGDISTAGGIPELLAGSWRYFYSGSTDGAASFHLINPLIGLILPQRSFMFGLPLALTILWLLINTTKKTSGKAPYLIAGALAGMLPLFHAHTVLVLAPILVGLVLLQPNKLWLYFFIPAGIVGLPQVAYYLTAPSRGAALTLKLGWMQPENINWLFYWFLNTGLLVPLAAAGLFLKTNRRLLLVTGVGLLLFAAANIWLIAQWEWDNTKIFLYWLLLTLPMVGKMTVIVVKRTPSWAQALIVLVLLLHGLSGFIDLSYLILHPQTYDVWDANAVIFAEQVEKITPKKSIIVTAPIHNSSIELTGRPRYMGYSGHVWSHGIDGQTREQALRDFYEGRISTLPEIATSYVVVSPAERAMYQGLIIAPNWQLLVEQGPYQLYKIN